MGGGGDVGPRGRFVASRRAKFDPNHLVVLEVHGWVLFHSAKAWDGLRWAPRA